MLSRRSFFKVSSAGMLTLWVNGHTGMAHARTLTRAVAMNAGAITPFTSPLLVPPVMPRAARLITSGGKNVDYYEIAVRQFRQQVLPAGMPMTTVWGYGAVRGDALGRGLVGLFHAPSLTIEARAGTPVRVKWINDLKDADGHFLPHLLPVDPTLHWANPGRLGSGTTDSRPDLTGRTYRPTEGPDDPVADDEYTRYWGPVPMVTHVHGAVGVGDDSDGYPEAWYLPAASNLTGYASTGTWYGFFRKKALAKYGVSWGRGHAVFEYPNQNRASTIWYHDHTLGLTRQNVYAGPAGFYLVRGGPSGDGKVVDTRTGQPAVLPGPAPKYGQKGPRTYFEIPLAIQDRSFTPDGELFYPDTRSFFDGNTGPYIPESEVSPLWNPEVFGNTLIVNGRTWPHLLVEQRRYRFRVLNGCQSRFLILDFSGIPRASVWQIGNEGGFLPAPVQVTGASNRGTLLLAPAERADLIVDFTRVPVGNHVLRNVGPDEPFGGGEPDEDFDRADPQTTGRILQFRVKAATAADPSTPPRFLRLPALAPLPVHTVTRRLALLEHGHEETGPTAAALGWVTDGSGREWDGTGVGHVTGQMWEEPLTTNPRVGATEVWELYNVSADAHPIHVHEVTFEVVNRQAITVIDEHMVSLDTTSAPQPPQESERGRKDTVVALPGQVTRIKARFANPGQFVWHCHLLEHEDNEMMLAYRIGPVQPGQPGVTS